MKKTIRNLLIFSAVMLSFQFSCHREEDDITTIVGKTKIQKHNYVIVTTDDGSPAEVEVSYATFTTGNAENTPKNNRLTTPFVIGGEPVLMKYDSVFLIERRGYYDNERRIKLKKDYTEKGADRLIIKNLSAKTLHYCVVSNEPLTYFSSREVQQKEYQYEIANPNEIDAHKILKHYPLPVYKGTPVLYLFKPDLAPQGDVYVYWERIINGRGKESVYVKKFPLKTPHFGELTLASPMALHEVVTLYKQEEANANLLFDSYDEYHAHLLGLQNRSLRYNYQNVIVKWYGTIAPNATLENGGQVWFVNTKEGNRGKLIF